MIDMSTAKSALHWWRLAGVDTLAEEEPVDWLDMSLGRTQPPGTRMPAPPEPVRLPESMAEFLPFLAREAARHGDGTHVAPTGLAGAEIMVLVDMPEVGDDAAGRLLSGPGGTLFDAMLSAIGRSRDDVFLAAFSSARPASGQIAGDDLERLGRLALHLARLAGPKRLLLLGDAPSRALLGAGLVEARGQLRGVKHDSGTIMAMTSFSPSFLLAHPLRKADAWRDLQLLGRGLSQ